MPSHLPSRMRSSSHQLEYLPLPNPGTPQAEKPLPNHSPSSRLRLAGLFAISITTTSLLLWLLSSLLSPQPHQTKPRYTNCGTTPAEARRRGCHFDMLSFAWQTPECFDGENTSAFLAHDAWKFYTEFNSTTQTVGLATALKGDATLVVDWKYHVTHCTYMWRQMHRAYAVRGWIDEHLDGYGHTLHCQATLLDRERGMGDAVVVGLVRFPECRRVR